MNLESSVCTLDKFMYFLWYAGPHTEKLLWDPYLKFSRAEVTCFQ